MTERRVRGSEHPILPAAAAALMLCCAAPQALPALQRSAYEELQTFSGVLNYVRLNYVDSVSVSELVRAAIGGVLSSLDPHSFFVSREDFERRMMFEQGQLGAPGVLLEEVEGVPTVVGVTPKSPAAKAGILPGDRLVMLDDTSVAGLGTHRVVHRLLGPDGSKVRLTMQRGSRLEPDTFVVTLRRTRLTPRSVVLARMVDPATALVRLESFGPNAAREVRDAIKRLRGDGAVQAILDLRGNPGGEIAAAVDVASEFFPVNTLLFRTRGRKRDVDQDHVTKRNGEFTALRLSVLIDEHTASAAEALAGALQDHDRALILGRRSFGKALIQQPFPLPSGDVVWLTIGRVVTPSGRIIQRQYRGLSYEQYLSYGGTPGETGDTLVPFRTDRGRRLRGGGGIMPDVSLPSPPSLPVWWSVAAASGLDDIVVNSAAGALPADRAARARWMTAAAEWRALLVSAFLARTRSRYQVTAEPDSALEGLLARILALRVAEVRWGPDAGEEFFVRNDPEIKAAAEYTSRAMELLAPVPR
jgi:carboxyl-terminal processing protease